MLLAASRARAALPVRSRLGGALRLVCATSLSGMVLKTSLLKESRFGVAYCEARRDTSVAGGSQVKRSARKGDTDRQSNMALLASLLTTYDWVLFGISALCSVLASLMTTAQARIIGKLFDSMGKKDALEGGLTRLLTVFALQAALSFASSTSLSVATTNLGSRLRVSFFSAIIKQDMAILDERKTGELTHQLSQDVASLQTAVRESFTRGVESVTSLVSGSILLYSVSPSISMYLFGLLPLGAFAGTFLGEALRNLSQLSREAANRATGVASECISNVRTIRAFASEEKEIARYAYELQTGADLKTKMAAYSGAFYSSIGLGINLTTLLIMGWGHRLIEQGALTKGDIATIATQVQMLERALARLSVLSASMSKAMKSSQHIFDTIKTKPTVNRASANAIQASRDSLRGEVQLRDVRFSYPSRKDAVVLDNMNIVAHPSEVVALVGASGSGKSTIFALVERFYDPVSGAVLLDGVDLKNYDPQWLRRNIGYVPQKPELFSGTVAENIRYGNPDATQAQIEEAARRANAHDFIKAFPQGYNTVLGQEGLGISGGQKQRIAIARTLLLDPKVLLLGKSELVSSPKGLF